MMFSAVQVLGKELRRAPNRALVELRARTAAASVAVRLGAQYVVSLEAPLRGQVLAGSQIVQSNLHELGIGDEKMVLDCQTRSTREEAVPESSAAGPGFGLGDSVVRPWPPGLRRVKASAGQSAGPCRSGPSVALGSAVAATSKEKVTTLMRGLVMKLIVDFEQEKSKIAPGGEL